MNWNIFLLALVVNTVLCYLQFLAERVDMANGKILARHAIIPNTNQKFLYWEDFYMQTYGDLLGLVWVMNAFFQLVAAGKINNVMWFIFALFAVLGVFFTLKTCLAKNHKPDWGYPEIGKISLGGISHLPYFGIQLGMGVVCLIKAFTGELTGLVLISAIGGGIIIVIMAILDWKTGHFDPLIKIKTDF
jgi:hypothetical protein